MRPSPTTTCKIAPKRRLRTENAFFFRKKAQPFPPDPSPSGREIPSHNPTHRSSLFTSSRLRLSRSNARDGSRNVDRLRYISTSEVFIKSAIFYTNLQFSGDTMSLVDVRTPDRCTQTVLHVVGSLHHLTMPCEQHTTAMTTTNITRVILYGNTC